MDTITKLNKMLELMEKEPKYLEKQKQCRLNKKDREISEKYKNVNIFQAFYSPI